MQAHRVDTIAIKTVGPDDRSRVNAILATAFTTCPLLRWLYPAPWQYLQHFSGFIEYYCGDPYRDQSGAYISDGDKAALLWQTESEHRGNTRLMSFLHESVPAHRRSEAEKVFESFGKYHPPQPHWYVTMVGVDPVYQRSGLGSLVLKHLTDISDKAGGLVYLEATSAQAVRLYERLGWTLLGEVQIGTSPPFFPMSRSRAQ
ncbi:GNAT family N-acetyltransferase [Bradyrhizobium sp. 183]|uniref:GNAT family N-acetyltransferase n=1 Tax=unclassified Bradyrhizobium TaxID=2631580 RepID=UPI001FFF83A3|nr:MULTISPECIES: GNAT family N-acetyltransferase [unclassified Bradyrhizobium]UPJ79762.1 GNAT family N-acetyltransferase [Bradyrhizobium sp. 184]UPJ87557.1 GNAT family N-acetyltransferase [Bradyrhizobium sp. 183]